MAHKRHCRADAPAFLRLRIPLEFGQFTRGLAKRIGPARLRFGAALERLLTGGDFLMADFEKVHIIGIGDDGLEGLPQAARDRIEQADLVIGDPRTLDLVSGVGKERLAVGGCLDEVVERIAAQTAKRIVVLATGDPLFYGLARYLCDELGKDRFEVAPHVSTMQLAFARVVESWEEAYLTNLANHPLDSVIERIRTADKVGLFTTDRCTPGEVARGLLERRIDYFLAYVCENLGSPDERVTRGSLEEIAEQEFAALNVMILVRRRDAPDRPREGLALRLFGNPEEAFLQSKPKHGLLTPAEVRAMALAELELRPTSIVWDVGAGSGSVSIEAARIAAEGTVYALEMDAEDYQLIQANARRFAVSNVVAVLGKAPDCWADLPDPDSVFVEGSGREISRIIEFAFQRLRLGGRLVANVGSIENLADVHRTLSHRADDVRVWMVNLARGTYQLERVRFDALNPTFLLAAGKKG
ncbi:MAG: bifunctional cobalt-precorrin-7 (C(5))-methyltransferase/cobalt-precorrin-6B (C(15))-methyltransferase [Planctomycetia bacterium]|nr:MAG: bifunctional cobalt-precorrin-7 (C(5))-methyltransferase/cobalt-precorrin-6B (C(15))-methyltransferase [Planctomycetia bacterium]